MKQILISIKPEWVAKILNGDKTIEIRKTMPKCELPCKVYIYCTKEKSYLDRLVQNHNGYYYTVEELVDFDADDYGLYYDIAGKNGQVVAEFTLKQVEKIYCCAVPYAKSNNLGYEHFIDNGVYQLKDKDGIVFERDDNHIKTMLKNEDFKQIQISPMDIYNYLGGYGKFYAWHIDDLKIYDEPRELREFRKDIECHCCFECRNAKLQNPPQSWCYVMEACND